MRKSWWCTLTGGVGTCPEGLRTGRPFWLSRCLLFTRGLFTVPPWSLRTESARSATALPSSLKEDKHIISKKKCKMYESSQRTRQKRHNLRALVESPQHVMITHMKLSHFSPGSRENKIYFLVYEVQAVLMSHHHKKTGE